MNYFNQESDRLVYRKLTIGDVGSWSEFFADNDRLSYLGIDLSKNARQLATEWIDKQLKRYETDGLGHLAVIEKQSGLLIGMGGILTRELNGRKEFEIAYSLKPPYWGRGYGTEIAKCMKRFGHENKIAERFISIIHKDNTESMNVAVKNGMVQLYGSEYLNMPVYIYGDKR